MSDIEDIVAENIKLKVLEALNNTEGMVEKLVRGAFEKPVSDRTGRPKEGYSPGEKEIPWLDWLLGEEIRMAATTAMREYVAANAQGFKDKVAAAIASGDVSGLIAENLGKMMAEDWRWNFSIQTKD